MPATYVEKQIQIDASVEQLEQVLSDFNQWLDWSPWLLMEPEAKVVVSPDNHYYEWDGNRVGSGNMQFLSASSEQNNARLLSYSLTFLKPWKSKADVEFLLKPNAENSSTHVTWIMRSTLPFFLFWMKNSLQEFIGMDYVRGLNMLKEHIETGKIATKLEFVGHTAFEGGRYVGIETSCHMDNIGPSMQQDFVKLKDFCDKYKPNTMGTPFTIYHKWDVANKQCKYSAAILVDEVPSDLPDNMTSHVLSSTSVYCLRHVGDYKHLGNAWSTLYTMQRNKEISVNEKISPIEVYRNDPQKTATEELITDIMFALN